MSETSLCDYLVGSIMYRYIDIVDIIGSTIYKKDQRSCIRISELKRVVGRIETDVEHLRVDISKRKINMAKGMLQIETLSDNDVVMLPESNELRRQLVLKYFQLDQEIRRKIEDVICNTLK